MKIYLEQLPKRNDNNRIINNSNEHITKTVQTKRSTRKEPRGHNYNKTEKERKSIPPQKKKKRQEQEKTLITITRRTSTTTTTKQYKKKV